MDPPVPAGFACSVLEGRFLNKTGSWERLHGGIEASKLLVHNI